MERCDVRYRLSITLCRPMHPPTRWIGGFTWDAVTGFQLDCQDLPSDVARAVLSGLRRNGHYGDGCMLSDGRYVSYSGRAA
jgi:hypothetical protein